MGKIARTFRKGDLIFAKMKGYPYWPARIETTTKELIAKKKYNILFYGTHDTSVLKVDQLLPYNEETRLIHGQKRRMSTFNEALWEIESDPKMKRKQAAGSDQNKSRQNTTTARNGFKAEANGKESHSEDSDSAAEGGSGNDLEVSHEDGLLSYERFCKYIAQFECTTTDQIQSVRDIYKNISAQFLAKVVKELKFENEVDQMAAKPDAEESTEQEIVAEPNDSQDYPSLSRPDADQFDQKEGNEKIENTVAMATDEPIELIEPMGQVKSAATFAPMILSEVLSAAGDAPVTVVEKPFIPVTVPVVSIDVSELINNGVGLSGNGMPAVDASLLEANMAISDDLTDQNIVDMVKEGVEVEEAFKSTN